MKKLITLLVVCMMALPFAACKDEAEGASQPTTTNHPAVSSTASPTPPASVPETTREQHGLSNQPSAWAQESIARALELGLVTDELNSAFQSTVSRGEFCRLAMRLMKELYGYAKPISEIMTERGLTLVSFNDTDDPAIRAAATLGITSGTGNGNFSPDQALTREQAATMLCNVLNALGVETANPARVDWTDASEIADWAREAADVVYAAKIMGGTSTEALVFGPKSPYTREQAIVTVLNLWDYVVELVEEQGVSLIDDLPTGNSNGNNNQGQPPADPPASTPTPVPPTPPVDTPTDTAEPTAPPTDTATPPAPPTETPAPPPPIPTEPPPETTPTPSPPPANSGRQFNMSDPNVQRYPIYATAQSPAELQAARPSWQSAQQIIAHQKSPDNMIGDQTFYDWRMRPIQEWVDNYLAANGLTVRGRTDYQKTAIIRHIIEAGRLEEFIGLWQPGFQFTSGDCAHRSNAVTFLMIALDFELFDSVTGVVSVAHGWNAYWDSTVNAVRFIDAALDFNVWNLYVDELAGKGFIFD